MLALLKRILYEFSPWVAAMPDEYSDERLVFRLHSEDPIALDTLGEGFAGLARQFRRHLEDNGFEPDEVSAKLLVTRVASGSIEFELATFMSLYMALQRTADGAVIWMDFYDRIKQILQHLAGQLPRPPRFTKVDARDFDAFLKTVAGKRNGRLSMTRARFEQRTGHRETLAEFNFTEQDVANAHMVLAREVIDLEPALLEAPSSKHKMERGVPFIWFRTDRERGKASGQTSDRGIIAKITEKPLPVYFASSIDSAKDRMTKLKANPFDLVYIVDAAIEYDDDDNPKSYTIMNINEIVGAPPRTEA
jgi:hypothetical protein